VTKDHAQVCAKWALEFRFFPFSAIAQSCNCCFRRVFDVVAIFIKLVVVIVAIVVDEVTVVDI
jgi:hypothetical protein